MSLIELEILLSDLKILLNELEISGIELEISLNDIDMDHAVHVDLSRDQVHVDHMVSRTFLL